MRGRHDTVAVKSERKRCIACVSAETSNTSTTPLTGDAASSPALRGDAYPGRRVTMSWFDAAGLTSLAKSALKEAQRTIDKALDIEENEENILPPSTLPVTSSAQPSKGLQEKLKDESESFFASFGLDKKKSPLTPVNSPVDSSEGKPVTKDGGKPPAHIVGSLWGSFTGSFFENSEVPKEPLQNEGDGAASSDSPSKKSIVATQPPRSSASLPSLQLASSPVSTQPRTTTLQECAAQTKMSLQQEKADKEQGTAERSEDRSRDVEGEWGWGWESGLMVSSDHQHHLEGTFSTAAGEIEEREDSLVDDTIDEEGFAKSRLVVGSVESDAGGFVRQESQGSLSGRSVDLDVPVAISEDVFHEEHNPGTSCFEMEPDNSGSVVSYVEECTDTRTTSTTTITTAATVSCGNSEVNTPESIVVLTSESNSPDDGEAAVCVLSTTEMKYGTCGPLKPSPISSPDSIEVLGSSSLLTSPSSIEVLTDVSSSDSSPSHLDSCNNTLVQDLSPPPGIVVNVQPTLQKITDSDTHTLVETSADQTQCHQKAQPIEGDKTNQIISKEESLPADYAHKLDLSSVNLQSTGNTSDTVTPQPPTTLSLSLCKGQESSNLAPSALSVLVDSVPSKPARQTATVHDAEVSAACHASQTDGQPTTEEHTVVEEGDISIPPATALDVSVESGGSSDTITASIDSTQMVWSISRGVDPEFSERPADSDMHESSTSGSGGSVVRCLLEEAMGDEEAVSGASSSSPPEREHSPSSSESPSLDGSTVVSRGTSAGTSRVWSTAQRGMRSFLNDRSESSASDSSSNHKKTNSERVETVPSSMTTSFTSISESEGEMFNLGPASLTIDPASITQVLQGQSHFVKGHRRNQSNFSETSESSSENHSSEVDKLIKKVGQLTEVLEARETKVLELSQVNAALQDTNLRLKAHVEDLEGGSGMEATESLREEFTQRLVTMERKFQQALREKENTKKLLEEARAEAATRLSSAEVARYQEERDTVIRELREEGEKLSKQQLSYSNIIKKLRSKEKENETTIKTQKDKLEEQSRDLERLRKQLSAKEEMERRQIDAVCQLNATNQRLEQAVKDVAAENAELEGKMTVLKSALDTAYREMAELKREVAACDAQAQEQVLSAEVGVQRRLEATLAEAQEQARREQVALMAQVVELQEALNQCESQANRKERQLRADNAELQQRVAETEARAEEMSGAVSAATRPLLRQMENLQATHSSQQASWESLEASLTQRLNETLAAAAASTEKERATREQYAELAANTAALQTQVTNLRAENARVSSELNIATTKFDSLSESRIKENIQIEALKTSFAEEIAEVKRERDSLEQQLEMEKTAVAAEKKKSVALQEQLKDRERKLAQMIASGTAESHASTPRSSPTPSLSRLSITGSLSESFTGYQWGHEEVFESGWSRGTSLYDSVRSNSTAAVDALTSQLRQREGEVHHLHSEITRYETQRESLAQELVSITSQVESLQSQVQDYQALKDQYADMEQKYNALLQMHGEKVEEVEELRLDLADVKEMYKAQIDQLLKK
ncbi:TATA element modulatory factor-like isoform X3 [Portunus trituberculatus]|uniref:TATA element modulatory factor-like isoform X3 n=1 Tax=Portunus trituberculatus TaxID=210409 RepID=UPI001E1CCE0B|nr:TATA element modulatory factor-like isoform X3 [Portunus trituberculatus]